MVRAQKSRYTRAPARNKKELMNRATTQTAAGDAWRTRRLALSLSLSRSLSLWTGKCQHRFNFALASFEQYSKTFSLLGVLCWQESSSTGSQALRLRAHVSHGVLWARSYFSIDDAYPNLQGRQPNHHQRAALYQYRRRRLPASSPPPTITASWPSLHHCTAPRYKPMHVF